ncbi:hypothetical protein LP7551_05167 [Roseibium album]|nr:hypothetical protein LP7551_05167 [Roseibium album]
MRPERTNKAVKLLRGATKCSIQHADPLDLQNGDGLSARNINIAPPRVPLKIVELPVAFEIPGKRSVLLNGFQNREVNMGF